ncbi:hypothetical protein [Tsukamurella ocularis]|uniref:hypothetical protein n=1 Tax=Tsukamurella ocularis TaxID=1970234 RepID=UPI00216A7CEB|nr:hypothetical protein [Tsukamurella ocularis]MCS3781482.1 hypothetical protein [Tsukamurella ocularis]MCS3787854.1 hypothetical protein [Tsukamurella ocularis]MCS3851148.1 hypothetical protein [Tsukamurella ocularis]
MAEQTLTSEDLGRYATALAEGKNPLVYLIEGVPSLGLAAGASARVVAVDGVVVTVKPTGVDDQLPYEARELRATKQPKPVKRAPKPAAAKAAPAKAAPAKPAGVPASARAARSVAITVYVGADNTAALKVTRNAQKPAGAQEISLPAVHKALAGLADKEALATVDEVLSAARDAAADRVAALQAELAAAKKSLATLDRAKRGSGSARGR